MAEMVPTVAEINRQIAELLDINKRQIGQSLSDASVRYEDARTMLLGMVAISMLIAMGTAITIVARTSLVLRLVASSFSSPLADTLSLWFVPT